MGSLGDASFVCGEVITIDEDEEEEEVSEATCKSEGAGDSAIGSIKQLEERIKANEAGFAEVERKRAELNATVEELKQAVLLRTEMEKCASRRVNSGVQLDAKAKFIFPSTVVISIVVSNLSAFRLNNWSLLASYSECDRISEEDVDDSLEASSKQHDGAKPKVVSSKVVGLPSLSPNQKFESVLAVDSNLTTKDLLVDLSLMKVFHVAQKQPRVFRIELDSKLLTSWDLLLANQMVLNPMDIEEGPKKKKVVAGKKMHNTECLLPRKMLFLLMGKNVVDPLEVLRLILGAVAVQLQHSSEDQATFSGFLPSETNFVEVELRVEKKDVGVAVTISTESKAASAHLLSSLQAKILVSFGRIWREPLGGQNKAQPFLDFSTRSSLWASLCMKFE